MSERLPSVDITLLKRSAEAASAVTGARAVGKAALLELVVGIRVPDHDDLMLYGYEPNGQETTEVTIWPEDMAVNLHDYYANHYAQPDTTDIDCFDMVDRVMGYTGDGMGAFEPAPIEYHATKPGRPLILMSRAAIVHAMIGLNRPGYALSVSGRRRGANTGQLVVASNRYMMRAYGSQMIFEITDQPIQD